MKNIGQAVNTLANLGVIAGIVLLALELNQNNALLESGVRQTRLENRMDGWSRLYEHPEISALLIKDRNGDRLSDQDEFILNAFWMETLATYEWNLAEYPDDQQWIRPFAANFGTYGSLRRTWQGNDSGSRSAGKQNFDPEFIRFVDDEILAQP